MAAGATYTPLATQTLGSATPYITFSSISGSYTDLVLVFNGTASSTNENIYITLNGDTGSNYSYTGLMGTGSVAISFRYPANTWGQASTNQTTNIFQFMSYRNTTNYKTTLFRTNDTANGTLAQVGLWRNTSAIDSIKLQMGLSQNFASGSTFTLYGIAAA